MIPVPPNRKFSESLFNHRRKNDMVKEQLKIDKKNMYFTVSRNNGIVSSFGTTKPLFDPIYAALNKVIFIEEMSDSDLEAISHFRQHSTNLTLQYLDDEKRFRTLKLLVEPQDYSYIDKDRDNFVYDETKSNIIECKISLVDDKGDLIDITDFKEKWVRNMGDNKVLNSMLINGIAGRSNIQIITNPQIINITVNDFNEENIFKVKMDKTADLDGDIKLNKHISILVKR